MGQAFFFVGVAVTALVGVGVAIALIRGSYNKAHIEPLRGDNEDLRNKVKDLREDVSDLEHQAEKDQLAKVALSERVSHVENENDLLKQLVTQRADVETLKTIMTSHRDAAIKDHAAILAEVRKIRQLVVPDE